MGLQTLAISASNCFLFLERKQERGREEFIVKQRIQINLSCVLLIHCAISVIREKAWLPGRHNRDPSKSNQIWNPKGFLEKVDRVLKNRHESGPCGSLL
jgi:hypothetical protein